MRARKIGREEASYNALAYNRYEKLTLACSALYSPTSLTSAYIGIYIISGDRRDDPCVIAAAKQSVLSFSKESGRN